jgi:hypothetical protein
MPRNDDDDNKYRKKSVKRSVSAMIKIRNGCWIVTVRLTLLVLLIYLLAVGFDRWYNDDDDAQNGGLFGTSRFLLEPLDDDLNNTVSLISDDEVAVDALEEDYPRLRAAPQPADQSIDGGFLLSPYRADFFSLDELETHATAIFYHIVLDPDDPSTSLRVVEDQMEILASSDLVQRNQANDGNDPLESYPVVVYYNTVGIANYMNHNLFRDQCRQLGNFTCVHMKHYHLDDSAFLEHGDAGGDKSGKKRENDDIIGDDAMADDDKQKHHHRKPYISALVSEKKELAIAATEMVTLARLYEFCTALRDFGMKRENDRVIYLRSFDRDAKPMVGAGLQSLRENEETRQAISLSLAKKADYFRPLLTAAPLTKECNGGDPPSATYHQCDVCGFQFNTQWSIFLPGNMFSAKVSYVQKLLSPQQFREKYIQQIVPSIMAMVRPQNKSRSSLLSANLFPLSDEVLGRREYAAELWITSHPDMRACDWSVHHRQIYNFHAAPADVDEEQPREILVDEYFKLEHEREVSNDPRRIKDIQERIKELERLEWSMAPRSPRISGNQATDDVDAGPTRIHPQHNVGAYLNQPTDERIKEYFFLAGHLYKWIQLYNKLPVVDKNPSGNASWVFDAYPDGKFWNEMIGLYGLHVFDKVILAA